MLFVEMISKSVRDYGETEQGGQVDIPWESDGLKDVTDDDDQIDRVIQCRPRQGKPFLLHILAGEIDHNQETKENGNPKTNGWQGHFLSPNLQKGACADIVSCLQ